ncbi:FMN-binding protein [Alkaliphilus crotonatoxidans]
MSLKKKALIGVVGLSMLALTACGGGGGGTDDGGAFTDGTYKGTGEGYNGPIEIELVVENGKISDMNVLSHEETEGISDSAFEGIKEQLLEKQSAEGLDTVSGATGTSNGLIEAINAAMPEAQK